MNNYNFLRSHTFKKREPYRGSFPTEWTMFFDVFV